jgi:ubiquinone/menaquinone biosynthesis C-methylase UbiE
MHVASAATVLDMGCGTGLAARAIARRPGFTGTIIGVDLSAHFLAAAKRLAGEDGIADRVEFRTGDAGRLEFPDATFDAVVAHTLLSHVAAPSAVLEEAVRVMKPGATIGIFDGDYASLTFGHADPLVGKAHDEAVIGALVENPSVMRQMPRWLRAAGLELVTSLSFVLCEAGTADFWASAIEAYRRLLPGTGVMNAEQADAWAAALRRDSAAGVFFGASNYYAYVARRP